MFKMFKPKSILKVLFFGGAVYYFSLLVRLFTYLNSKGFFNPINFTNITQYSVVVALVLCLLFQFSLGLRLATLKYYFGLEELGNISAYTIFYIIFSPYLLLVWFGTKTAVLLNNYIDQHLL